MLAGQACTFQIMIFLNYTYTQIKPKLFSNKGQEITMPISLVNDPLRLETSVAMLVSLTCSKRSVNRLTISYLHNVSESFVVLNV